MFTSPSHGTIDSHTTPEFPNFPRWLIMKLYKEQITQISHCIVMKSLILVLLVAAAYAAPADNSKYLGAQVVRTHPSDVRQLSYLRAMLLSDKYDFWTEPTTIGKPVDIMASRWKVPELLATLVQRGIQHKVMIYDVQRLIKSQEPKKRSTKMDWTDYHEYAELLNWMDGLASDHSDIVSVKSIGKSYEGRDMKMLTISSGGSGKPSIFVDGGIHAREWISPATVTYIMNEIITMKDKYMDIIDAVDMHFIPSINPDGYAYTWSDDRLWRKTRSPTTNANCKGADPNRNWGFHWNEVGASDNPCSEIYAGAEPFSEIEMANVRDQLDAMKDDIKAYLTFHSYSQLWMYPWGFTTDLPDDWKDLDDLAQNAVNALTAVHGKHYDIGSSTNTIYAAAGGSDDWAKGTAGIKYAYTIELRDTGFYGFQLPKSQIIPSGEETFAAFEVVMNFIKDTYGK